MANTTGIGTGIALSNFAKEGRLKSIVGTNALQNPLLDADNGYPIGYVYNGQTSGSGGVVANYPAHWSPCSGIYIDRANWKSIAPCNNLSNYRPYDDTSHFGGEESPEDYPNHLANINYSGGRVRKMYGVGTSFNSGNADPDNGYINYNTTGTTGSTRTIDSGTPWGVTDAWAKYEWTQGVSIPDNMNSVTFGAYIRCPSNDLFRPLNFGGVYIWQRTNTASEHQYDTHINAIAVKRASTNLDLKTGVIGVDGNGVADNQGQYHWSGNNDELSDTIYNPRWNHITTVQSITYKDAEDYPEFKAVEKTITLQSGTNRRLGFGTYFMENHSYMPINPPDPNPLTGSIDFYNPFVIFSS